MTSLRVHDLTMRYSGFTLGPVSLDLTPGVSAVLGPNGSGKSTLIAALMGLLRGATGSVRWGGADLRARGHEVLRDVAYVCDTADALFPQLSAWEYWRFVAGVRARSYGEESDEILATALDLADRLDLGTITDRICGYSLGMRRKAQLIGALMCQPALLVVDEPQNALDFTSSHELRTLLTELADGGGTVLMSNHDLDSVARVADRIIVLRDGQVVGDRDRVNTEGAGLGLEGYVRQRLGI